MTLAKGHLSAICQHLKGISSETTGPISIKFLMQPQDKGDRKHIYLVLGHMVKIAAMPMYGKTLKNRLQNYWVDCLETWCVASGTLNIKII